MDSVRIPLTQGQFALIDRSDVLRVLPYRWRAARSSNKVTFYARAGSATAQIWMHRLLLNAPIGIEVDHINGDGLDNRRSNLRLASRSQNQANTQRRRRNRSGYKGVWAQDNYWLAKLGTQYLGMFDTAEKAARAYDTAARTKYGAYAGLNFPV